MTTYNNDYNEIFGDMIYSYTRKQAIEDGELVDVSLVAKDAGFIIPVAFTRTAYLECVYAGDDELFNMGRLWDILNVLRMNIQMKSDSGSVLNFKVKLCGKVRTLKSICGPGDDAEPVITIMFPDED